MKLISCGLPMPDPIHTMGIKESTVEFFLKTEDLISDDTDIGLAKVLGPFNEKWDPNFIISPWFTSLWTLQESMVRPDSMLCSADFEVLTSSKGLFVTLDMINSLLGSFDGLTAYKSARTRDPQGRKPLSTFVQANEELRDIFSLPGLWRSLPILGLTMVFHPRDDFSESPATILNLASFRDCIGARAEAIMSAVGATDWYQGCNYTTKSTKNDDLLCGYPFAFVQEVRQKLGALLFLSTRLEKFEDLTWPRRDHNQDSPKVTSLTTHGTM